MSVDHKKVALDALSNVVRKFCKDYDLTHMDVTLISLQVNTGMMEFLMKNDQWKKFLDYWPANQAFVGMIYKMTLLVEEEARKHKEVLVEFEKLGEDG
jgi:hypothetical protein